MLPYESQLVAHASKTSVYTAPWPSKICFAERRTSTDNCMMIGRIADLPLDQLDKYTQTNMHAAVYLIQPALPYLRASRLASSSDVSGNGEGSSGSSTNLAGRIVLTSSGASQTGYAGWSWYCMAKSGMNALARVLAVEEKEKGVAVWAVRPGVINVSLPP